MATERFPRAKYLRQLRDMQQDLQEWSIAYAQRGDADPYGWRGGKLDGRAAVLEECVRLIVQLRDTMYGLPRLS